MNITTEGLALNGEELSLVFEYADESGHQNVQVMAERAFLQGLNPDRNKAARDIIKAAIGNPGNYGESRIGWWQLADRAAGESPVSDDVVHLFNINFNLKDPGKRTYDSFNFPKSAIPDLGAFFFDLTSMQLRHIVSLQPIEMDVDPALSELRKNTELSFYERVLGREPQCVRELTRDANLIHGTMASLCADYSDNFIRLTALAPVVPESLSAQIVMLPVDPLATLSQVA